MKVKSVKQLKDSFLQCDVTTHTGNFYIKAGDKYILVHNSPALLVWSSYGQFSRKPGIALKGALSTSGVKKLMHTPQEVDRWYSDRPDMADKLKLLLDVAPSIPEDECWQGDVLFSADTIWEIEDDLAFQPNKIVYRVPIHSETGKKIAAADAGIAFHTRYKWDAHTGEIKQNFHISTDMLENPPSNIFIMDANVQQTGISPLNDAEKTRWTELREELTSYMTQLTTEWADEYESLCNNLHFMNFFFMTFQNKNTSDKKAVTLDTSTFIRDLQKYAEDKINSEYEKKVAKLKTDKGRENAKASKESQLNEILFIIDNNSKLLVLIVEALNAAAQLKMLIWKAYKSTGVGFNTYLRTVDGYEPTANEGLAVSDNKGNILKVVDRTTFSNANRDPKYLSGFEHPQYKTQESMKVQKRLTEDRYLSGPDLLDNELSDVLTNEEVAEFYSLWGDTEPIPVDLMFRIARSTLFNIYHTYGFVRKTRNMNFLKLLHKFLEEKGIHIELGGNLSIIEDYLKRDYQQILLFCKEKGFTSDDDIGDFTKFINEVYFNHNTSYKDVSWIETKDLEKAYDEYKNL